MCPRSSRRGSIDPRRRSPDHAPRARGPVGRWWRPLRRQRGVAAVDVVVWVALLVIGVGAIGAVHAGALRQERGARAEERAHALADDLLEELAALPAARVLAVAGERPPVADAAVTYRRRVGVTPVAASPSLWKVRVTVRWDGGEVALETLRTTREGP